MLLYYSKTDGQAQARSSPNIFGCIERLKNVFLHLRGHTLAIVLDNDLDTDVTTDGLN